MKTYNQTTDALRSSRADRWYLHTMTAGAWLPVVQSGLSGVIVFAVVLAFGLAWRWRSPLTVAAVVGVLATGLTWLQLQRHWIRLTLPEIERLTGLDLNGDGRVGETDSTSSPLSERQEIRVVVSEIKDNGHLSGGQFYDFPCTADQLLDLARGLLQEAAPFSERSWCGAGRPFSVVEFRQLRGEFIRRGLVSLASVKDARQGYGLTLAGRHVLAGVLAELSEVDS